MADTSQAIIRVKQLQNPKYAGKRGRVPRYAAIHHASPLGARWQPTSGDPHWGFTTRKWVAGAMGRNVQVHIQKFIGSGGVTPISAFVKKFEKRAGKLTEDLRATPVEAARAGVQFARQIAPRDTGSLIQAIGWQRTGNK